MLRKMNDVVEPKIRFSVDESAVEVDGQHILAKVRGEFFFPDGESRNKRFYPKKLWENVIVDPDVRARLKKKIMFGTVGHDAEMNDKAIRDGLISHFMSNIYIDENGKGIGEAYILNTPVGKILNTILRAGSEICVSSRADGRFDGTENGLQRVDPDGFKLVGWDFVIDPGFLQANPGIAESWHETIKNNELVGGTMELTKLVEHITEENGDLKKKNAEALADNAELKDANQALASENDHMKQEVSKSEEAFKKLREYDELGTPEEIETALKVAGDAAEKIKAYSELGEPEEIEEAFKRTVSFTKSFSEKFGSIRQVSAALESAEKIGKRIAAIGTLPQIEALVEEFEEIVKEKEAQELELQKQEQEKVESELSDETGLEKEEIKEMLKKQSPSEIRAIFSKVVEAVKKRAGETENVFESRTSFNNPWVKREVDSEIVESTDADISESIILSKSTIDRINERLSK